MKIYQFPITIACATLAVGSLFGAITINGPSRDWTPIDYGSVQSDYFDDNQGGQNDIDIVGGSASDPFLIDPPAIQFKFDNSDTASVGDDLLAFRIRVGGPNGNKTYFTGHAWIGFDVNQDNAIDVFVGASGDKDNWQIGIYDAGTNTNTGPNSTSIKIPALQYFTGSLIGSTSWDWSTVASIDVDSTNNDLDGKDPDHFLSFSFSFSSFVDQVTGLGFSYDADTPVGIVAATSNSEQTLNGDFNGFPGDTGVDWEIGDPTAVPEPSTYVLWLGIAAVIYALLRRRCMR